MTCEILMVHAELWDTRSVGRQGGGGREGEERERVRREKGGRERKEGGGKGKKRCRYYTHQGWEW